MSFVRTKTTWSGEHWVNTNDLIISLSDELSRDKGWDKPTIQEIIRVITKLKNN